MSDEKQIPIPEYVYGPLAFGCGMGLAVGVGLAPLSLLLFVGQHGPVVGIGLTALSIVGAALFGIWIGLALVILFITLDQVDMLNEL